MMALPPHAGFARRILLLCVSFRFVSFRREAELASLRQLVETFDTESRRALDQPTPAEASASGASGGSGDALMAMAAAPAAGGGGDEGDSADQKAGTATRVRALEEALSRARAELEMVRGMLAEVRALRVSRRALLRE